MFDFFPVTIVCILLKCYFLDFYWIFYSFSFLYVGQPFVHKPTANWRSKYSSTVCAHMFGWRFMHKCSSAQIVHRNIRCPIYRAANGQQMDVQNIRQPFDICNILLCIARVCLYTLLRKVMQCTSYSLSLTKVINTHVALCNVKAFRLDTWLFTFKLFEIKCKQWRYGTTVNDSFTIPKYYICYQLEVFL